MRLFATFAALTAVHGLVQDGNVYRVDRMNHKTKPVHQCAFEYLKRAFLFPIKADFTQNKIIDSDLGFKVTRLHF